MPPARLINGPLSPAAIRESIERHPRLFHWVIESVLDHGDAYFHPTDLAADMDAQHQVDAIFRQPAPRASKAILSVARIGRFSSDRTFAEDAKDSWGIAGVPGPGGNL